MYGCECLIVKIIYTFIYLFKYLFNERLIKESENNSLDTFFEQWYRAVIKKFHTEAIPRFSSIFSY